MAATPLPTDCIHGEWETPVVFGGVSVNVPVVAGAPAILSDVYELNFAKSGLGMALWVNYIPDPAHPTNTLTVGALWSTRGGSLFFPAVDGPSVTIAAPAVIKICCPGTPDFEFTLSSTGTGTDHVTAILCGTCGCCGKGGC
jgi:hypothetical protein